MTGRTISHYKILEKLGEGGMGIVYKAYDTKLNRDVAIKFFSASHVTEQDKAGFIHEARAASALEHPHICTIHEIDETPDGQMFLVMPCYDGIPLNKKIEDKPIAIDEAIGIAIQIADGIQAAHDKGLFIAMSRAATSLSHGRIPLRSDYSEAIVYSILNDQPKSLISLHQTCQWSSSGF